MLDGGIVWEPSWQQVFNIAQSRAKYQYISFGEIIKLPGAQFSAPKLERRQFKAARFGRCIIIVHLFDGVLMKLGREINVGSCTFGAQTDEDASQRTWKTVSNIRGEAVTS